MPKHTCRAPSCKRAREEWALTCRPCWRQVPDELKEKVTESHRLGFVAKGIAAYAVIHWLALGQREMQL